MERIKFSRFILISLGIHLFIAFILCLINIDYYNYKDSKIIEISLIDLAPSFKLIKMANSMVEEICKKVGELKFKKRRENFTPIFKEYFKRGLFEKDISEVEEFEKIALSSFPKKLFNPQDIQIKRELKFDKLDEDLGISKDLREEYPLPLPNIENEKVIVVKEDESLLKNPYYATKITGPVSWRKILYQEGFKIPNWLEKKGLSLQGRFRFWVLPNGYVDRVMVEESFGYREIDSLASTAIMRWRFSKLPNYIDKEEEWGIIDIKILLR